MFDSVYELINYYIVKKKLISSNSEAIITKPVPRPCGVPIGVCCKSACNSPSLPRKRTGSQPFTKQELSIVTIPRYEDTIPKTKDCEPEFEQPLYDKVAEEVLYDISTADERKPEVSYSSPQKFNMVTVRRSLLNEHVRSVAEFLTYFHFQKLFGKTGNYRTIELLTLHTGEEERKKILDHTVSLHFFILSTILTSSISVDDRVNCLRFWHAVANQLFHIGNLFTFRLITFALKSSQISKLTRTWDLTKAKYSILTDFIEGEYKKLTEDIVDTKLPVLPDVFPFILQMENDDTINAIWPRENDLEKNFRIFQEMRCVLRQLSCYERVYNSKNLQCLDNLKTIFDEQFQSKLLFNGKTCRNRNEKYSKLIEIFDLLSKRWQAFEN